MPEIRTVHTARTAHDCQTLYCATTIRPGDRYLAVTLPPGDALIGNEHWERMRICQPCATRRGQTLAEQARPRRLGRGQIAATT